MRTSLPRRGGVAVVELEGPLDYASHERVKRALRDRLRGTRPNLLVDLTKVPLVDSMGLGALLSVAHEANRRGGQVKFCSPTPTVERLFRVTRLYFVFEIFPDREEALDSF